MDAQKVTASAPYASRLDPRTAGVSFPEQGDVQSPAENEGSEVCPPRQTSLGTKGLGANILFGGLAGVTGTTIIFPLYTLKTHLMTDTGSRECRGSSESAAVYNTASKAEPVRGNAVSTGTANPTSSTGPALATEAAKHTSTLAVKDTACTDSHAKLPTVEAAAPARSSKVASNGSRGPAAASQSTLASTPQTNALKAASLLKRRPRLVETLQQILRSQGVRGLYRGLTPVLIGVAPEKAIKLAANDFFVSEFKERSPNPHGPLSVKQGMLAGAGAGLCQVIATNPMEVLMITMQTRAAHGHPQHSVTDTIRMLGLRGLYRGVSATLTRDIPFSMVFFGMNTSLKERLSLHYQGGLPMRIVFGVGILSGVTAAALSTPFDVVKTRIQSGVRDRHGRSYHSVVNTLVRVVREEGFRALWSGAVPRVMIVGPLFGITLLFYELQQRLAQSAHQRT